MSTTTPKSSWLHLRLSHLFLLQLLFVPLFLAPLYDRLDLEESKKNYAYEFQSMYGPMLQMVAYLLAPAVYTGVFAYWSARRAFALQTQCKRSVVFAAIRARRPPACTSALAIRIVLDQLELARQMPSAFEDAGISSGNPLAGDLLIAISLFCVYLLPVGASLGGLIGLVVDARRHRGPGHPPGEERR